MSRFALGGVLALLAASACSETPHVRAPLPAHQAGDRCVDCCDESVAAIELDPASTLDFRPSHCALNLAGWYALSMALLAQPRVDLSLLCQEHRDGVRSLSILYHGAPVGQAPLTDLLDPFHTGGREEPTTVSFLSEGPRGLVHLRFERGEVRFDRPPRSRLEAEPSAHGKYVEVGVDLRFEGDRRFRAALRLCPTYERTGPVSDPID